MSGRKGSPTDAASWLRRETPKHLDLLTKLREKLEVSLTTRNEDDADGNTLVVPADLNDAGTPTRDWCRAFNRYQYGWSELMQRELEFRKLALLASKQGSAPLTDDEYEREMRELGREAVQQLDTGDLVDEFMRRGLAIPAVAAYDGEREPD